MTTSVLYDKDADPARIRNSAVCVVGYGSQGSAQARNLRDSGVRVVAGLRPGSASAARCERHGIPWAELGEAVAGADVVAMLIPDEAQAQVYGEVVASRLRAGGALLFAHGFAIRYGLLQPRDDIDVIMSAPLGIADQVRSQYVDGGGTPGLLAVHQDVSGSARAMALSYAWANGHCRTGVIETTFTDETETDLFAEQAVLCGGVTHLITAAFETLERAGYPPELAYFSCLHELKLITDLICERGIAGMRKSISGTAEFGDYSRGPRIIDKGVEANMAAILEDIRDGTFAAELGREMASGSPTLLAGRRLAAAHPIEAVGRRLRTMMTHSRSRTKS